MFALHLASDCDRSSKSTINWCACWKLRPRTLRKCAFAMASTRRSQKVRKFVFIFSLHEPVSFFAFFLSHSLMYFIRGFACDGTNVAFFHVDTDEIKSREAAKRSLKRTTAEVSLNESSDSDEAPLSRKQARNSSTASAPSSSYSASSSSSSSSSQTLVRAAASTMVSPASTPLARPGSGAGAGAGSFYGAAASASRVQLTRTTSGSAADPIELD